LNNAIKFKSPERKPEILIRTTYENSFVILSIKDNGIGIDDTNQKDIFSKYYRINNVIEGSGIGLYLVKELVTNAGGKISIESQLNKGTEFKIYLKEK
jgi:signal transduction histidine kinase